MSSKGTGSFVPPDKDYLSDRLWDRILSFRRKGIKNRKRFHSSQIIIIIAGALIPIVNVLELGSYEVRIISSVLGGVVIAVTSIQQLVKYQENWIMFRTTEEALRREYYLFKSDAGEYSELPQDQKKKWLVEKAEALLLSQYSSFLGMHKLKPKVAGKTPPTGKPKPEGD